MTRELAKSFGAALQSAREATGRTTEQAADLLYCDHDYYCRLESGQSLPSLYLAARAVDRLGVDPAAALGAESYSTRVAVAELDADLLSESLDGARAEAEYWRLQHDEVHAQGAASIAALRQECEALQAELGRVRADRDAAIAAALAMPEVP